MPVSNLRSPTRGLLVALFITLAAVAVYSAFTVRQIQRVRELQQQIVDRHRRDSLQLLRIQEDLNSLGLLMRDILEQREPYPLTAWQAQFRRIEDDLTDALAAEARVGLGEGNQQTTYLNRSVAEFRGAADQAFNLAAAGREAEARRLFSDSLEARRASIATQVSRLLVGNNESERQAAEQMTSIYRGVERNIYIFLSVMLITIFAISARVIYQNRLLFRGLSELAEQRRDLSQRLIATQEDTLRSVSRELHDEFGQILTAIGMILQRASRRDEGARESLLEVREITQNALSTVRSLSQSLQPVILDEQGLLAAVAWYLPVVQRQTGLRINYEAPDKDIQLPAARAIHVFRILQEALTNVVKHAGVRLQNRNDRLTLEVQDHGAGMARSVGSGGIGLAGMRERAALIDGKLDIQSDGAGTLVRLSAPLTRENEA
jgi:signal transduction histidine kinase